MSLTIPRVSARRLLVRVPSIFGIILSLLAWTGLLLEPTLPARAQTGGEFPSPSSLGMPPGLEGQAVPGAGQGAADLKSLQEALSGGAQSQGSGLGGQALVPLVQVDDYFLGPGDSLVLNIWGTFQALYQLTVYGDGKIIIPAIGGLYVNGLSLAETQSLVNDAVRRYYREAKTALSLAQPRTFEVRIIGQARKPGTYLATSATRVLQLVAKAEGPTEFGSTRHIEVSREGKTRTLDLLEFQRHGNSEENPTVKEGDVISIPPKGAVLVTVKTTVIKAGQTGPQVSEAPARNIVELREGEGVLDLLELIGGFSPWWDSENSYIQRNDPADGPMTIPINPYRLVVLKDMSQNIPLKNADVVIIPLVESRIYVIGQVRNPGTYLYLQERRALDYIIQAGGGSEKANFSKAYLHRRDGTMVPLENDPDIMAGEAIVIPEVGLKWWQDYTSLASVLLGLVFATFALATLGSR